MTATRSEAPPALGDVAVVIGVPRLTVLLFAAELAADVALLDAVLGPLPEDGGGIPVPWDAPSLLAPASARRARRARPARSSRV
jgi:hypothetical protein